MYNPQRGNSNDYSLEGRAGVWAIMAPYFAMCLVTIPIIFTGGYWVIKYILKNLP